MTSSPTQSWLPSASDALISSARLSSSLSPPPPQVLEQADPFQSVSSQYGTENSCKLERAKNQSHKNERDNNTQTKRGVRRGKEEWRKSGRQ